MATITYFPAAAAGGGTVATVVAGSGIAVNASDAANPIVTNTLITGLSTGQTVIGGLSTTNSLTLRPNAADTTTGRVVVSGLGVTLPDGVVGAPSIILSSLSTTGFYKVASGWGFSVAGTLATYHYADGIQVNSAAVDSGFYFAAGLAGVLKDAAGTNGIKIFAGNAARGYIRATGSWVTGTAALATNATDGFLYIPTCAGTPTGVPSAQTGTVAMIYDTTNNKFYIYNAAWKGGTAPGVFS